MRTSALKGLVAVTVLGGIASICPAQVSDEIADSPPIVVTAGQGGSIRIPRLVNVRSYALTGAVDERQQSRRQWQRQVGPDFRVGQAAITLPQSR